jgi:hypothetical protein
MGPRDPCWVAGAIRRIKYTTILLNRQSAGNQQMRFLFYGWFTPAAGIILVGSSETIRGTWFDLRDSASLVTTPVVWVNGRGESVKI